MITLLYYALLFFYPTLLRLHTYKNVGVFASMLYVYYKFHMQCVNQQKGRKTVVLLQLRYDEEKNQSQKYIYIKQNKETFMIPYLLIQVRR